MDELRKILTAVPAWLILAYVAIQIIRNPDIAKKWAAMFWRCWTWVSTRCEQRHVAADLEYRINTASRAMNSER